jgi:hypothetical protein
MQVPISVRLRRTVVPVKRPPLSTFVMILDLTKQVHAYASAREAAPPTE